MKNDFNEFPYPRLGDAITPRGNIPDMFPRMSQNLVSLSQNILMRNEESEKLKPILDSPCFQHFANL